MGWGGDEEEEEQDRHAECMWGRGGNKEVREEQGLKKKSNSKNPLLETPVKSFP